MDEKRFFDFGGYRNTKENALLVKQRREKILEMRESGLSFDHISKIFSISKARCRKIYSVASQKPKSLKMASMASVVRDVLRNYLPALILKDGSFIKLNYSLLFIILGSKNDYFKRTSSKPYVRLVVHSVRADIILAYNKLLSKLGAEVLAEKWIRSDNARVPSCFWSDKNIESFLLGCFLNPRKAPEVTEAVKYVDHFLEILPDHVQQTIKSSPDFGSLRVDNSQVKQKKTLSVSLLKETEELVAYLDIIKSDDSLKREDYISVLESALSCLNKFKEFFEQKIEVTASVKSVDKVKEPVKAKPKSFWPKPKF